MKHDMVRYELLPLLWWEHPGYIAAAVASLCLLTVLVGCLIWRSYRIRYRPQSVAERLLTRLELLKKLSYEQPRDVRYAYTELMRIIREFATSSFGVGHDSLTDEEFVTSLEDRHNAELSTPFTALAVTVSYEACQVKFAAESIDHKQLMMRLDEATLLIRSYCTAARTNRPT